VKIFCPSDGFEARDSGARFCPQCGDALCHPCPSCGRVIPTRALNAPPTQRCPGCDAALWQCRTCGWLATPGHADCENPSCPRGSLVPQSRGCSQLGGGSGRTGRFKIPGVQPDGGRLLAKPPPFTRVSVAGEIRGTAVGTSRLWLFCADPGGLYSISLPGAFASPLSPQSVAFTGRPHPDAVDPITVMGDRLYLLTAEGAIIRSEAGSGRLLPGVFVAQCLHEKGWLLVESDQGGTRVHRYDLEGEALAPPTNFGDRAKYAGWSLPVADDQAAYLTDDQGRAWRFPWDGGTPSPLGTTPGTFTTLMLDDGTLYVLPVGSAEIAGQAISLVTGQSQPLAPVQRPPLAFALDAHHIWLGRMSAGVGAEHLVSVDRKAMTAMPRPIPGVPEPALHLCTLMETGAGGAVIALLKGNTGLVMRGWYSDPPFTVTAPFMAALGGAGGGQGALQRLLCCDAWLGVWSGAQGGSEIVLYHLAA